MQSKAQLRAQAIAARQGIDQQLRLEHSAAICHSIGKRRDFKLATTVAIYAAINAEVNLNSLFEYKKELALPIIIGDNLRFSLINKQQLPQLSANNLGILEPDKQNTIDASDIDLCLMPVVGFDQHLNRLGMGGGFYDRFFAANNANNNCIRIGVAFTAQYLSQIPTQSWDIKMHHLVTENYTLNGN